MQDFLHQQYEFLLPMWCDAWFAWLCPLFLWRWRCLVRCCLVRRCFCWLWGWLSTGGDLSAPACSLPCSCFGVSVGGLQFVAPSSGFFLLRLCCGDSCAGWPSAVAAVAVAEAWPGPPTCGASTFCSSLPLSLFRSGYGRGPLSLSLSLSLSVFLSFTRAMRESQANQGSPRASTPSPGWAVKSIVTPRCLSHGLLEYSRRCDMRIVDGHDEGCSWQVSPCLPTISCLRLSGYPGVVEHVVIVGSENLFQWKLVTLRLCWSETGFYYLARCSWVRIVENSIHCGTLPAHRPRRWYWPFAWDFLVSGEVFCCQWLS